MKLNDLDYKNTATEALKSNFDFKFDPSKLDRLSTQKMWNKVRGLMQEAKQAPDFHQNQRSASYLKLVFMEQALSKHFKALKPARIVVENEKIEQSQVYLASQDLVDEIQKMLESIGEMQVKELPALVDSIESEIGVQESQSYNEAVSAQLDTLSAALKEAFIAMKAARDGLTGDNTAAFSTGMGMPAAGELPAPGEEDLDMTASEITPGGEEEVEADIEEPAEPVGGVGRAKR